VGELLEIRRSNDQRSTARAGTIFSLEISRTTMLPSSLTFSEEDDMVAKPHHEHHEDDEVRRSEAYGRMYGSMTNMKAVLQQRRAIAAERSRRRRKP
jgi:hypothetical protein